MLPVSIPNDSLLVSGLKDIQEHCAEDKIHTTVRILWLFVVKIKSFTLCYGLFLIVSNQFISLDLHYSFGKCEINCVTEYVTTIKL